MESQDSLVSLTYTASAASWPFTAMSTIIFGMRMISVAHKKEGGFRWDDFIVVFSFMLNICRAAMFQKALDATRLIDPATITESLPNAAFWVILSDSWSAISIALPKAAIGLLIIRIFRPQPWIKFSIYALFIAINVLCVIGFILSLVQCDPVQGQWDPFRYPQTRCWPRNVTVIYTSAVSGLSAFIDFTFAVYPGVVVWSLQMARWKKFSTSALMGLGLASTVFACIKLDSNLKLLGHPSVNTLLYNGIRIGLWNAIENDFVLSAACLPAAVPFYRSCKKFLGTKLASSNGDTHQNMSTLPTDKSQPSGHFPFHGHHHINKQTTPLTKVVVYDGQFDRPSSGETDVASSHSDLTPVNSARVITAPQDAKV